MYLLWVYLPSRKTSKAIVQLSVYWDGVKREKYGLNLEQTDLGSIQTLQKTTAK